MEVVEEGTRRGVITGQPRNDGNREVETGGVEGAGAVPDERGQQIAVGPGNLLEVKLEAGIAVGLCFIDQVLRQRGAFGRIRQDGMPNARIDILIDDQRNDRDSAGVRRVDHIAPRIARDASISVGVVPRGAQHIDLVEMGKQGGVAVIRVDVIHLHHPSANDLGQGRRDHERELLILHAPGAVRRANAGVDRDDGAVRKREAARDDVERLRIVPAKGWIAIHPDVSSRLRAVGDRAGEMHGGSDGRLRIGSQVIEMHADVGDQRRRDLKGGIELHRSG